MRTKVINWLRSKQDGDTIVEVMLSMAILGVVMGTAYATSTRSFQSGLNAQYRDQAVYYAQQQLELIKEADNNVPSTISTYQISDKAFCINPATLAVQDVPEGQQGCSYPIGNNSQNLFQGSLTYNASTKVFTSDVQWTSADNRASKIDLYYKASDSFADALGNPPTTSTTTTIPEVTINFTADDSSVAYKGSTTLHWSSANATKCWKAGGAWGADAGTNIGTNGSYPTGTLTASANYTIGCLGPPGQASSALTVSVGTPPTPQLQTLTPIVYGDGNVYFRSNINPNGYTTTAWYQWGINPDLSGCALTTSAFGEPAVNFTITDTRFGSYWGNGTPVNYYNCNSYTYYYRVCAYSTFDTSLTVCGNTVLFGMLAPSVTTGGATHDSPPGVSNSSGWELYGTVNPNGNNIANCYFKWDNDSDLNNGEQTTYCSSSPGGGTSNVGVTTHIDLDWHYRGEEDNKDFYYRLCADTGIGLGPVCGSVQSFHTR